MDDDEDKKNPAYVPRKGAFYEHDLRTGEEDVQEKDLKPKKKLWQDEGKWSHDRFRDDLQAPKTPEELFALYGYDILTSDKPPDAPPPRRGRGRGRGKPQRHSVLSEFIELEKLNPPLPEPPQQFQRMAVIDTTDSGNKRNKRSSPLHRHEDFEDDIEVPFMTTIDTSKSSASNYHLRGQRRGVETGQRGRRDRAAFSGYQQSYTDSVNNDQQTYRDNRHIYSDRGRSRSGNMQSRPNPSQDIRYMQQPDSPRPEIYSQDFPSLDCQSGGFNKGGFGQEERPLRNQGDFRNKVSPRLAPEEVEEEYSLRNNYARGNAGGTRGGFSNPARGGGRDQRNDRNNRPPRYSRMEREDRPSNVSTDVVPASREFTNSSYRNNGTADIAGMKNVQAEGTSGPPGRQTSQDVVISNKENVQTISVTITNTTTERKSYAKERRGNNLDMHGVGKDKAPGSGDSISSQAMLEAPPVAVPSGGDHALAHRQNDRRHQGGMGPSGQQQPQQEQTRPKRYSSQRQRNMMEMGYGDPHQQQQPPPMPPPPVPQHQQLPPQPHHQQPQKPPPKQQVPIDAATGYFKPGVYPPPPQGHPAAPPMFRPEMAGGQLPSHPPPPTPQDAAAAFTTAMLQPPMPFHMPVNSPGMPSPPRMMAPNMATAPPGPVPVPINTTPQMIPASYMTSPGVIYTAPPPMSGPYQVPLAYTSPPPTAPPPTLAQPPIVSPQTQPEVHRGGTVYFPPYLQQPSQGRSPARRPKVAIPIVDPTELKKKNSLEGSPTPIPDGSSTLTAAPQYPQRSNHQQVPKDFGPLPASATPETEPVAQQAKMPSERKTDLVRTAKADLPAASDTDTLVANIVTEQMAEKDIARNQETVSRRDNVLSSKTVENVSSSLPITVQDSVSTVNSVHRNNTLEDLSSLPPAPGKEIPVAPVSSPALHPLQSQSLTADQAVVLNALTPPGSKFVPVGPPPAATESKVDDKSVSTAGSAVAESHAET